MATSVVLSDALLTIGAQFEPSPIGSTKLPLGCKVVTVVDSIVLSDVLLTLGPIVEPFEPPPIGSPELIVGCTTVLKSGRLCSTE